MESHSCVTLSKKASSEIEAKYVILLCYVQCDSRSVGERQLVLFWRSPLRTVLMCPLVASSSVSFVSFLCFPFIDICARFMGSVYRSFKAIFHVNLMLMSCDVRRRAIVKV